MIKVKCVNGQEWEGDFKGIETQNISDNNDPFYDECVVFGVEMLQGNTRLLGSVYVPLVSIDTFEVSGCVFKRKDD